VKDSLETNKEYSTPLPGKRKEESRKRGVYKSTESWENAAVRPLKTEIRAQELQGSPSASPFLSIRQSPLSTSDLTFCVFVTKFFCCL
jgi:hypothetical protein